MTSLCGLYYMVVTYDSGFLVWVVLGLLFSWLYYVFYDVVYPPRFVATFSTRQTLATKTRRNQAKQYKTSTRYGFPFVHYAHSPAPPPQRYTIVPVIDWEWSQRRHMLRTQWSCTWNMCHVNPMIRTSEAPCVILLKLLNNKLAIYKSHKWPIGSKMWSGLMLKNYCTFFYLHVVWFPCLRWGVGTENHRLIMWYPTFMVFLPCL